MSEEWDNSTEDAELTARAEAALEAKKRASKKQLDSFANDSLSRLQALLAMKRSNVNDLHEWHERLLRYAELSVNPLEGLITLISIYMIPMYIDTFTYTQQSSHPLQQTVPKSRNIYI